MDLKCPEECLSLEGAQYLLTKKQAAFGVGGNFSVTQIKILAIQYESADEFLHQQRLNRRGGDI